MTKSRSNRGFTLLEIIVVVTIIAILAAYIAPKVAGRVGDARISKAKADIKTLESSLELYKLDNFVYPTTDQGLEALVTKPAGTPEPKNWKRYMDRLPKDPWGEPYQYLETDGSIQIISRGADGQPGGEGPNTDITNSDLQ